MHRHYINPDQWVLPRIVLEHAAARHLQTVLRVKVGMDVELFDGCGRTVVCQVSACERHGLTLEQAAAAVDHPAPACRITLALCVSKGKRMDWSVEKAAELGAMQILPILSENSVVRIKSPADAADKQARWRRIAIEATRQCGSAWIPEIAKPQSFNELLPTLTSIQPLLAAVLTSAASPLRAVLAALPPAPPEEAAWIVGPEGDFTDDEVEQLLRAGALPCSLGRNILRTETAALYGLAVLNAMWGATRES